MFGLPEGVTRLETVSDKYRNPPRSMAKLIASSVVWTKSTQPFLVS